MVNIEEERSKCTKQSSFMINLPKQRTLEESIKNIEKNVIILNNSSQLKEMTPQAIKIWIFKMENTFELIKECIQELKDAEILRIVLNYVSDSVIEWYIKNKKSIKTWDDFKKKLIEKYSVSEPSSQSFKINDWVRIFNYGEFPHNSMNSETGLIIGIEENDLYEITCKGKVLKMYGSNLEKI